MKQFEITGKCKLTGEMEVQGAKNSVLPILAASILINGESIIHNCPRLRDVDIALEILLDLGCNVTRENDTVIVDASDIKNYTINDDLMRQMRSSIMFLGPILARCKKADLTFPGGCELGPRPIDLHISALLDLGAKVIEDKGHIYAIGEDLHGSTVHLSFPSVGATENIIMAAVYAKGQTKIINCAREPEIEDLVNFLNKAGAKIKGAGGSVIIVEESLLSSVEYTVMPDRIASSTYLVAAAITGGEIILKNTNKDYIIFELDLLSRAGCNIRISENDIMLSADNRLNSIKTVKTMPYPGFPTDAAASFVALMTKAKGSTLFIENIFENRFRYVSQLVRMGADIKNYGKVAIVTGVQELYASFLSATDLRGGAAMVLAALSAEGTSVINDIHHIDRGYEDFEGNLQNLGAKIKRV